MAQKSFWEPLAGAATGQLERLRDLVARRYFNHKMKSFGARTNLEIDSENKNISLDLELNGEAELIRMTISNYRLVENGKCTFFEVGDISASRAWINALLAEPAVKQKIKEVLAKPRPGFLRSIL